MPILDRWLIGRFLAAFLVFACAGVLLFLVFDLATNLDTVVQAFTTEAARARLYERYATMLPEVFFLLAPHLVLLSGIWTAVALARANELLPLFAAGCSRGRAMLPFFAASLIVGVAVWADREHVLPRLAHLRRERLLKQEQESMRPVPDGSDGVLSARWYRPRTRQLDAPRFVQLDARGGEELTVIAERAVHEPEHGGWRFHGGVVIRAGPPGPNGVGVRPTRGSPASPRAPPEQPDRPAQAAEGAAEGAARPAPAERSPGSDGLAPRPVRAGLAPSSDLAWGSGDRVERIGPEGYFIASKIRLSDVEAAIDAPSYMSDAELRSQLRRTPGFRHLAVQRFERFTQALAGLALLLVGLPLLVVEDRSASLTLRGLVCVVLSLVYFFLSTVCYELGSRALLPAWVAAFLPLALFGGVGLAVATGVLERGR